MANTKKPLISSVASGIIAHDAGGAHLKASDTRKFTSTTGAPSSQGQVVEADKDAQEQFERWRFILLRQDVNELLTREAADNREYTLLTREELLAKGTLTKDDIRKADTRTENVAGLPSIEIKGDDGKPSYLVGNKLSEYLVKNPQHTGRMTNVGETQRGVFQSDFKSMGLNIDLSGPVLMHPRLAKEIQKNPQIAEYVALTLDAAKRNGINGIMLANQYWQESKFNPNAGSNMGALGIGQIVPKYFMGKYGLNTLADFKDPVKSIEAGAAHMGMITRKYGGDQVLALAEYNGGQGAVDFAKKLLGKTQISGTEFVGAMEDQVRKLGVGDISLWRNQTKNYVEIIAGIDSKKLLHPEPS